MDFQQLQARIDHLVPETFGYLAKCHSPDQVSSCALAGLPPELVARKRRDWDSHKGWLAGCNCCRNQAGQRRVARTVIEWPGTVVAAFDTRLVLAVVHQQKELVLVMGRLQPPSYEMEKVGPVQGFDILEAGHGISDPKAQRCTHLALSPKNRYDRNIH